MTNRDDIVEFCNDLLSLHKYPDYGPMGLQYEGTKEVRKIACAVSASGDIIASAKVAKTDLLIVHHGLFWGNESHIIEERHERRLNNLRVADISLLGYHLALDAHPKIGNNILAARALGLGSLDPWEEIGWGGEYRQAMSMDAFEKKVKIRFPAARYPLTYRYGGDVKKVAVIVGAAPQYIITAARDGFDTFLTGEPAEQTLALAQDLKMNFIAAGHDATERSGVQHLAAKVGKRFGLPYEFIPSPNPV